MANNSNSMSNNSNSWMDNMGLGTPNTAPAQSYGTSPMQTTRQLQGPSLGQTPGQILNPSLAPPPTQGTQNMGMGMGTPPYRQGPPPVMGADYIPGYLNSNLGKYVRAEFIIGNAYLDKTGRLVEVGVNYFILEDFSGSRVLCDLYSVRFVTFFSGAGMSPQ